MLASPPPLGISRTPAQHGFTIIELMVVVAIVAILAALAAPSFTPLIERWRVRQTAEDLASTLYYARSEAIKRGGGITITADAAGWTGGWKVSHTQGVTTTDLQTTDAPTRTDVALASGDSTVYVDRWGMMAVTVGGAPAAMNFLITPVNKTSADYGAVRLCTGTGGRIQQKKGTESC